MKAYRGIALAIAAGVLLQAAFIAAGTFELISSDNTLVSEDYEYNTGQELHAIVGFNLIPLLAIVLLVVSLLTKRAGATKRAGMVFGAVFLQVVLALISYEVSGLGALHGINAFVVLGTAIYASRLAASPAVDAAASREHSSV